MSNISPDSITVATVLNTVPVSGTNVSTVDSPQRTFVYAGSSGDVVELWGSVDGSAFSPVRNGNGQAVVFTGATDSITLSDRSLYYATRRTANTSAGALKMTGETFPAGSGDGSVGGGVFIYQEGAETPAGNIFGTLRGALAAAIALPGSTVMVDNSQGVPTTEAVSYDFRGTTLSGLPGTFPTLIVVDNTFISNLAVVSGMALLGKQGTPVIETPSGTVFMALLDGAQIVNDVTASDTFIDVTAGTSSFSLLMMDEAALSTQGTARVLSAQSGSSTLVTLLNGSSLGATVFTGAGAIEVDIPAPIYSVSQSGAAALSFVDDTVNSPTVFGADTLVGLTAVASILPPGSRATTLLASGGPQPGALMSRNGRAALGRVSFVGDVLNIAGQTVTFVVKRNGSVIGTSAATATTAGTKTAAITIAAGAYVPGDIISMEATPSATLTANITNLKGSVAT